MDEIITNSQGETLDYTFHDPGNQSRDILIIGCLLYTSDAADE